MTIYNKPNYLNRVFQPFKVPIFDHSLVENHKTLTKPFYPAFGIQPFKHDLYASWTNQVALNKMNPYFNSICLPNKDAHFQSIKLFKKILYFK